MTGLNCCKALFGVVHWSFSLSNTIGFHHHFIHLLLVLMQCCPAIQWLRLFYQLIQLMNDNSKV